MKKRILLFTAVCAIGYMTLSSYDDGPAAGGRNCTGAKSSTTNCGGAGCHGSSSSSSQVVVNVTVDSSGVAVTNYIPGNTYTVNITSTFPTTQPQFGFQYAVVSGTGSAQVQAGVNSSLPAGTAAHTLSGLKFIEHTTPLTATSGTGNVSFTWVAPAAGTGSVTMYCTVNAVNGDDIENAADISNNTSVVLAERVATSGVTNVANNADVKAYPNPVTNVLNIETDVQGAYSVTVFDLNGRAVATQAINTGSAATTAINTNSWVPGMYQVVVEKQGSRTVIPVVKK